MPLLTFQNPIRFDFGAVQKLSGALKREGIERPFLVTDLGIRASGLLERITDMLDNASVATIYDGTPGNPTEEAVNEALQSYQESDCDGVVCIGGGSPMDLGKAVALMALSGGPLAQYDPLQGGNKLVKGVAPLIAIPTTLSAGEYTHFIGVTDEDRKVKDLYIDKCLTAKAIFLDPNLLKFLLNHTILLRRNIYKLLQYALNSNT